VATLESSNSAKCFGGHNTPGGEPELGGNTLRVKQGN